MSRIQEFGIAEDAEERGIGQTLKLLCHVQARPQVVTGNDVQFLQAFQAVVGHRESAIQVLEDRVSAVFGGVIEAAGLRARDGAFNFVLSHVVYLSDDVVRGARC